MKIKFFFKLLKSVTETYKIMKPVMLWVQCYELFATIWMVSWFQLEEKIDQAQWVVKSFMLMSKRGKYSACVIVDAIIVSTVTGAFHKGVLNRLLKQMRCVTPDLLIREIGVFRTTKHRFTMSILYAAHFN